jgi:flavodoxin I
MGISYFFKTLYLCSVTFKNESKMNKIGVFYGSTTGTTEDLARRIAEKLDVPSADVFDVSKLTEALVNEYDVLVLGSSTWGAGELQDDWYDGVKVLKVF